MPLRLPSLNLFIFPTTNASSSAGLKFNAAAAATVGSGYGREKGWF
jgi:hypothetical protein